MKNNLSMKTGNFTIHFWDSNDCILIPRKVTEKQSSLLCDTELTPSDPEFKKRQKLMEELKLKKRDMFSIKPIDNPNGDYCGYLNLLLIKALGGKPYSI